MKKFALTILALILISFCNAQSNSSEDGWYKATVVYSCPLRVDATQNSRWSGLPIINYGTTATYSLKIKIEDDRVVTIDFGNGGTVHSGYNYEGYTYTGGDIFYKKDLDGNITSATTTVTVIDNIATRRFEISIE